MYGPWSLPCLARYSHHANKNFVLVYPAQARATWNEVRLLLSRELGTTVSLSDHLETNIGEALVSIGRPS